MLELKAIFTETNCIEAVKNFLKSDSFKLTSYDIRPLGGGIEGLVGQHFIITVNYESYDGNQNSAQLFMKLLNPANKTAYELAMSINAYEKEACFYKNLPQLFENYNIDMSYAPKGYFCKPELLVLEDLSLRNFKLVPKKDMFDLPHLKKSLEILARFHSSSVIYEELKSKELGRTCSLQEMYAKELEEKLYDSKSENSAAAWFRATLSGLCQLIDLLPENGVPAEEFKKRIYEVFEGLPEAVKPSEKFRNAVIHGDLWTNNFMFNYPEDGENNVVEPKDGVLLDYQLLKYGPPAIDVIQLIVTDSRQNTRNEHFADLLDFYYDQFSLCLKRHKISADKVMPKEEFLEACELMQVPVRFQALADHSITFMLTEALAEAMKDDESMRRFLYDDRSKSILESFKGDEIYRDVLTEDLLELRDLMFRAK